ncbi:MAG: hypothetical protein WD066_09455 [Planctomycetaceae bacterium]
MLENHHFPAVAFHRSIPFGPPRSIASANSRSGAKSCWNAASSRMRIGDPLASSDWAFFSAAVGAPVRLGPAIRKASDAVTLSTTVPPSTAIIAADSSRLPCDSVPVKQNVFPANRGFSQSATFSAVDSSADDAADLAAFDFFEAFFAVFFPAVAAREAAGVAVEVPRWPVAFVPFAPFVVPLAAGADFFVDCGLRRGDMAAARGSE